MEKHLFLLASVENESQAGSFTHVLEQRLIATGENKDPADTSNVKMRYALKCTKVISHLNSQLQAQIDPMLGSRDIHALLVCIPIIICWAIVPVLSPNAAKRILAKYKYNMVDLDSYPEDSFQCLKKLLEIASPTNRNRTAVGHLILKTYLLEVLIALMDIPANSLDPKVITAFLENTETRIILNAAIIVRSRESPQMPSLAQMSIDLIYDLIQRDDGITSLYSCILGASDSKSPNYTSAHAQLHNTSQIILDCRLSSRLLDITTVKEYFKSVCKQLISILIDPLQHDAVKSGASLTISLLNTKKPKLCHSLIFTPVFETLRKLFTQTNPSNEFDLFGSIVLCNESDIDSVLLSIQSLLDNTTPEDSLSSNSIFKEISGVFTSLFMIYAKSTETKSYVLKPVTEILASIIQLAPSESLVNMIMAMITKFSTEQQRCARIAAGPNGGIIFVCDETNMYENHNYRFTLTPESLCGFLEDESMNLIESTQIGNLFLTLIESQLVADNDEECLENQMMSQGYAAVAIAIMGRFGVEIFKNLTHILRFVKGQLVCGDDESKIILGLTLLIQTSSGIDFNVTSEEAKQNLIDIKLILNTLLDHYNPSIRDLAQDAKVKCNLASSENNEADAVECEKIFYEAITELSDQLVPIRAHGMALLRKLVEEKKDIAKKNIDSILTIFMDLLNDEDSFIYLNAVKSLTVIANAYPFISLTKISMRYTDYSTFNEEYRLRIGESLLQIIQFCGNTLEIHATIILESVLLVLDSTSEKMQSSSMSLLSEIFILNASQCVPYIYRIISYLSGILVFCKVEQTELKRATLICIYRIFSAVGSNRGISIDMKTVSSLLIKLEYLISTDSDLIARNHAENCVSAIQIVWDI